MKNPIEILSYIGRSQKKINRALKEWIHCFNDHPLSTKNNWSPNHLWINGMLKVDNPLVNGQVDDNRNDLGFYGDDSEGPAPLGNSDNFVILPELQLPNRVDVEELETQLKQSIDAPRFSPSLGIHIYTETLHLVTLLWKTTIKYSI